MSKKPTHKDQIVLSTKVVPEHAELVRKAAKMAHTTVLDYMRKIVLEWAASDAKVKAPDMSVYTRKRVRGEGVVSKLTKQLGISKTELTRVLRALIKQQEQHHQS
jgi:hypothetical protein